MFMNAYVFDIFRFDVFGDDTYSKGSVNCESASIPKVLRDCQTCRLSEVVLATSFYAVEL